VQSAVVQHLEFAMHALFARHTRCPLGQVQEPPMPLQDSPGTVQSAVVQQVALEMQALAMPQAR
jgi:hypothetical protein